MYIFNEKIFSSIYFLPIIKYDILVKLFDVYKKLFIILLLYIFYKGSILLNILAYLGTKIFIVVKTLFINIF